MLVPVYILKCIILKIFIFISKNVFKFFRIFAYTSNITTLAKINLSVLSCKPAYRAVDF